MDRRSFLAASAGAALAACSAAPEPEPQSEQRPPNIVWVMADDLGWAHLGAYGQQEIETPNLDALARQSLRFTSAYSGCTVCAPSRSSLMTGLHTGHTPVRGNSGGLPLPSDAVTVAEVLREAGYATGCFGKWGLGGEGTEGVPNKQGFDEFLGPLHQIHAQYFYPDYLFHNEERLELEANHGGRREQYAPDVMFAGAERFVEEHADEPFFLYVPAIAPHHEFAVPEEDFRRYADRGYEETPFIREDRGFVVQEQPAAAFAGMVTRLDRQVGQLLEKIDDLGLAENTVFFFTSDNGPVDFAPIDKAFQGNGPFRGHKRDLYEGGLRVPMLVRWPGKVEPGVSDYPWAFWDFFATAAEIAGVESPPNDGQSVLPTLLGQEQEPPALLYWEEGDMRAVRLGKWKAIRLSPDGPIELYDLEADIGETKDVAAEHPDVVGGAEKLMATQHVDPPELVEPGWSK